MAEFIHKEKKKEEAKLSSKKRPSIVEEQKNPDHDMMRASPRAVAAAMDSQSEDEIVANDPFVGGGA